MIKDESVYKRNLTGIVPYVTVASNSTYFKTVQYVWIPGFAIFSIMQDVIEHSC